MWVRSLGLDPHLGRAMIIATMLGVHDIMAKAVIVLSLQTPLLSYDGPEDTGSESAKRSALIQEAFRVNVVQS